MEKLITTNQIISLQITRGIAALFVIYFHLDNPIQFGGFGVDLFFVLSGFVIALTVSKNPNITEFIINRISRLVPLYWILTLGIFCLALVKPNLLNSTTANFDNFVKSLLFIPYFKENGVLHPMLAVGWSLNYEMLFYGLTALALALNTRYALELTIVLVFALHTLGPQYLPYAELQSFLTPNFILDFCLGIIAFKVYQFNYKFNFNKYFLSIGVIFLYCFMAVSEAQGYSNRLWFFGLPSFSIILLCLQLEKHVINFPNKFLPSFAYLGNASYAIYLSHLYVIEFLRKIVPKYFAAFELNSLLGNIVAIILSVIFGYLLYTLIDQPTSVKCRNFLRRCFQIKASTAIKV